MFDSVVHGRKILCPEDTGSMPYSCVSAISIPTRFIRYKGQDKPRHASDESVNPTIAADIDKLEESASDRRKRDEFIKLIQSLGGSMDASMAKYTWKKVPHPDLPEY